MNIIKLIISLLTTVLPGLLNQLKSNENTRWVFYAIGGLVLGFEYLFHSGIFPWASTTPEYVVALIASLVLYFNNTSVTKALVASASSTTSTGKTIDQAVAQFIASFKVNHANTYTGIAGILVAFKYVLTNGADLLPGNIDLWQLLLSAILLFLNPVTKPTLIKAGKLEVNPDLILYPKAKAA